MKAKVPVCRLTDLHVGNGHSNFVYRAAVISHGYQSNTMTKMELLVECQVTKMLLFFHYGRFKCERKFRYDFHYSRLKASFS